MAHEPLKESALLTAVTGLAENLADLFQKELRLAKAELSANLSLKLQAGFWMMGAGLLAFLAVLLLLQTIVFALIAMGWQPHWACLFVAGLLAVAAAGAFYKGRADTAKSIAPKRSIRQIKEDVKVTKEQLL
jgi:uncharacterized membrane protein YqjE